MTTPRIEEMKEHCIKMKPKFLETENWVEYIISSARQAGIDEALERIADKIESKRHVDVGTYSKESTLLSTGYNHCIDDVHKIINGNNQEDE